MQRAICLLSWDGDHRDLHSFPTRRSSDLSSPTATRGSPRRRLACASGVAIGQWPLAGAAHPSWSLERSWKWAIVVVETYESTSWSAYWPGMVRSGGVASG